VSSFRGRVRCLRVELEGRGVLRALEGEVEGASPQVAEAIGDLVALMLGRPPQPAPKPALAKPPRSRRP
jgi:hypothetical protein